MKYSTEMKENAISRYQSGKETTTSIISELGIPRSTFYGWIKEYNSIEETQDSALQFTPKNFRIFQNRVSRLENIISILKSVDCTVHSPLRLKLTELERLYGKYSVHALCDALEVPRGTFYNHIFRSKRNNTWFAKRREELRVQIQDIYDDSRRRFGSGKITAVLRNRGVEVSPEMVRELMRDMGLISIRDRAKELYDKEHRKYQNHINQHFDASRPNELWVSDVTYFKFKDKAYYICAIIDLFSRMVVGYGISYRNSIQLLKATFRQAYDNRHPNDGLIFHADRGMNYRSNAMNSYLQSLNVIQSFSRAHVPYDNSVMESFFSNLKREELYRTRYRSEREFKVVVREYITFYNENRPHKRLNYKTPKQYEDTYIENKT